MILEQEIEAFVLSEIAMTETLGPDQDLVESELIDSAGFMVLLGFLEERFRLLIDEDVDLVPSNFRTIAAISAFVRRKSPEFDST